MMLLTRLVLLNLFICVVLCTVSYEFGSNIPRHIQQHLANWISSYKPQSASSSNYLFSLGNTTTASSVIPSADIAALTSDEAFIIRTTRQEAENLIVIAANGKSTPAAIYASYHVIQDFLKIVTFAHPFKPFVNRVQVDAPINANIIETPYWPVRGIHIHTEHPLELCEMLNGFGRNMSLDKHVWESQLNEWHMVMEWLVAHKQNRIEWVLLFGKFWANFADSTERQSRLADLVRIAHTWHLLVGIDVPIAQTQQHAWHLIRKVGDFSSELEQLHTHLDYLMNAGFDFLSTELGFSEFTSGNATRMLAWINATAEYLYTKHSQKKAHTKIHVSQGQVIPNFIDPLTNKSGMNYNLLPHYSDSRVGIMPHTVQVYALDDPCYTYGNKNFSFMKNFMFFEADKREVIWYPETAYYINYDINIPLFLPSYVNRRLVDLRNIAFQEKLENKRIAGQVIFSSGWEFGYWFNDVMAMRAAWNPHVEIATHEEAIFRMVQEFAGTWISNEKALLQFTTIMNTLMDDQVNLMIYSKLDSKTTSLYKKSGIAYLIGTDTWSEISTLLALFTGKDISTQPDKVGLWELAFGVDTPIWKETVRPILKEMMEKFTLRAKEFAQLQDSFFSDKSDPVTDLIDDLVDCAALLQFRSQQVHHMYEYAWGIWKKYNQTYMDEMQQLSKQAILSAEVAVQNRVKNFRINPEFVTAWRFNPTAYPYMYLFQAKTLFFWWRDYGKLFLAKKSPCFMNIINPVDIVLGEGIAQQLVIAVRAYLDELKKFTSVAECLAPPINEPVIPPFPV